MRYRLLETVAEYAAERLDEAGERGVTSGGTSSTTAAGPYTTRCCGSRPARRTRLLRWSTRTFRTALAHAVRRPLEQEGCV